MANKVYVYRAEDYTLELVDIALKRMLTESGFLEKLKPGMTAFLKLNLLMGKRPEAAVTTHPVVVRSLVQILQGHGLTVVVGDSPGGPLNLPYLRTVYRACGITAALEGTKAVLNENLRVQEVYLPNARTLQRFEVLEAILEADVLINVAKLKTHGMMTYTGAVKNLFGAVPGLTKAGHHFKLQDKTHFADHMVDIADYLRPDFSIIDGIWGMEGNGPSGGIVADTKLLLGSSSAFALDWVAADLIGIPIKQNPVLIQAQKRGLIGDYQVFTDVDPKSITPYRLPDTADVTFLPGWLPEGVKKWLLRQTKYTPIFVHPRCRHCDKCIEICPAQIITKDPEGYPIFDEEQCISCFCCHEVCPFQAIEIKRPWIAGLLRRK